MTFLGGGGLYLNKKHNQRHFLILFRARKLVKCHTHGPIILMLTLYVNNIEQLFSTGGSRPKGG